MSLRLRLLLAAGAAALLALVATDVVTYSSLRSYLYNQIDQQLQLEHPGIEHALDSGQELTPDMVSDEAPGAFCEVRTATGEVIGSPVKAFSGSGLLAVPVVPRDVPGLKAAPGSTTTTTMPPGPPPTGAEGGQGTGPAHQGEPAVYLSTAPAGASGPAYRVRVSLLSDGRQLVLGVPLTTTDATLAHLVETELLVTAAALVLAVVVGWWLVHLGLRPLIEVERTAEDVAGGELGRRVPERHPSTEVGRLARVLNTMLGRIEDAFATRDRTEAELRESESRMRLFLADASHELRTPLAAVSAYSELFEAGADQRPEDLARVLSGIQRETARMGELVADLLLLARLDEARPLRTEPTELVLTAAQALDSARAVDAERTVELVAAEPVEVMGDEKRIRQVIDNLLANVRAHTPPGTRTVVTIAREGEMAVIEVADDGPGLPGPDPEVVFNRFYRGDSSRSRSSGGSGLGLAIVQSIVVKHGGTVSAQNSASGGAVFTVRLPLAGPSDPEADQLRY